MDMTDYIEKADATARRNAACINACRHIATEALEADVVVDLLEAVRDALEDEERRAAQAAYDAGLGTSEWEGFTTYWYKTGREAIARATGEDT